MSFIVDEKGKTLFEEFIFPDEFYYYDSPIIISPITDNLRMSEKKKLLKEYSTALCLLCQCDDRYGNAEEYTYWNFFSENPQGMSKEEPIYKIEIDQINLMATIYGKYIYQVEVKEMESFIDCEYKEIQEHIANRFFWQKTDFHFVSESAHYFINDLLIEKQFEKIKDKVTEIEANDGEGRTFVEIFNSSCQ